MDTHTRIGATGSNLTEEGIIASTIQQCVLVLEGMRHTVDDYNPKDKDSTFIDNTKRIAHDQAIDGAITKIKELGKNDK